MRENADQNNPEQGHLLRSDSYISKIIFINKIMSKNNQQSNNKIHSIYTKNLPSLQEYAQKSSWM